MQTKASLTWAFAAISIFLVHAPVAVASDAANEIQVTRAMETLYIAATRDDLALFKTVTTPDFYSFDGGKRFNGEELMQLIKGQHAAGKIYVWTVTDPKVELYGRAALLTYTNRGSIQDADGTKKDVTWLESALLRKIGGDWKIHFFHSTRVPAKN